MRRRLTRKSNSVHQHHNFKRSVYIPYWLTGSLSADTPFKLEASLADLPNFTEFSTLFDQYKITGIKFNLIPRFNSTNPGAPTTVPSQIMTALDYDGNGPTTVATINQYQNIKITRGTAIHSRYFKPAVLIAGYQSTTSTAYLPKWNQFVDTANNTVPHYGLYGILPTCAGPEITYDLQATYYITCKQVK